MNDGRDIDADAHLREALRHAPDAQMQPPAALSELILRQARGLAAPPAPPPAAATSGQRLIGWWQWLTQPAVAAGFASLLLSTLVGLMWWDRPLDEAVPARAPAVAEAPAGPLPALPAPPPPTTDTTAPTLKQSVPPPAAPMPERKVAARGEVTVPDRPAAADAMTSAQTQAALAEATRTEATPTPAPAQRVQAAAPDSPPAPVPESQRAARMSAAPAADRESRSSASGFTAATAPTALASLRAEIAAEPERWVWRRDAEAERAMNPALLAWLGQFDSRFRAPPSNHDDTGTASTDTTLRLLREGQLRATLTLGRNSLRLNLARDSTARWQANVPAEVIEALKRSLSATVP